MKESSCIPAAGAVPWRKVEDTDLFEWIPLAEKRARRAGIDVHILETFNIPEKLPWPRLLPILDWGTNWQMIESVLSEVNGHKRPIQNAVQIMDFVGSEAPLRPRLFIADRSLFPTRATIGIPPAYLTCETWFVGRATLPMEIRSYCFAQDLFRSETGSYFDEMKATWFPGNPLRREGWILSATAMDEEIRFVPRKPTFHLPIGGIREVISVRRKDSK